MPYFGAGLLGTGRKYLVQPVYVEDLAKLLVDAIDLPATAGKRYEIGGCPALTWPEMYRTFARVVAGKRARVLPVPAWYADLLTRIAPPALLPFNRAGGDEPGRFGGRYGAVQSGLWFCPRSFR